MNSTRIITKWTGLLVLISFPYELAIGDGVIFFESKIRPALVKYCYECHSSESNELGGSLSLEFREDILRGGEPGPALVKATSQDSLLIRAMWGN